MLKITAIGNLTHDVELKMNENTVKVQLHRGMERLRQAFSTYDYIVLLGILGRLFVER